MLSDFVPFWKGMLIAAKRGLSEKMSSPRRALRVSTILIKLGKRGFQVWWSFTEGDYLRFLERKASLPKLITSALRLSFVIKFELSETSSFDNGLSGRSSERSECEHFRVAIARSFMWTTAKWTAWRVGALRVRMDGV